MHSRVRFSSRTVFAWVVCALGIYSEAPAQLAAIDDFLGRADGFALYAQVGWLTSKSEVSGEDYLIFDSALRGFGTEVLIDLVPLGKWEFELGFGYEQMTGFAAKEPTLDLRGSVRSLPTISGYATTPIRLGKTRVYVGLHTGFVKLATARGFDEAGMEYELDGDTFEFGVSVGLFNNGFFLEANWRDRDFRGIDWKLPDGVTAVPHGWPRSLNLSAVFISLGYQLTKPKTDETD